MFISNKELLGKLIQIEYKIDVNEHNYTRLKSIEQKLNNIDSNVNHIYFENQIIKHQLLLEDCIRESVNEINDFNNDFVKKIIFYIKFFVIKSITCWF